MVEGSSGLLQAFYPQRVLNKFLRGSPAPSSMSLSYHIRFLTEKVLLSYTIPSLLAVVGWSGLFQAFYPQGVLNKFLRGSPAPSSMSLPYHIRFLTEKVLLSYTIPSLLAVVGWSGLFQAFYPQGVLNKFLRGSPAPRSLSLPFHIPCLTEKVLLSYTIPSLLAVEGWSGLLQAF